MKPNALRALSRGLSATLFLATCAGAPVTTSTLPSGVFVNAAGDQTVTVSEDGLTFHIVLIGKRAGQVFDRSYKYRLRDDHKIEVFPVRDVDAVFGIGNFTWTENQGRIEQRERGTGTLLQEFVISAPAPP